MKKKFGRASIPVFVMILLCLIVLTSVTYAWFTASNNVQALGMYIQTETDASLEISSDNITFGETAVYGGEKLIVKPATSYNGATFYCPQPNCSALAMDDGRLGVIGANGVVTPCDLNAGTWGTYMQNVPQENHENYYLSATYYLRAVSGTFSRIRSEIEVKERVEAEDGTITERVPQTGVMSAVRVSISIGGNSMVYAPVTGYDKDYVTYNGAAVTELDTLAVNDAVIQAAVGETAVPVTVNIWYEGQDTNCTTYNAIETNNELSFSIGFAGVE